MVGAFGEEEFFWVCIGSLCSGTRFAISPNRCQHLLCRVCCPSLLAVAVRELSQSHPVSNTTVLLGVSGLLYWVGSLQTIEIPI